MNIRLEPREIRIRLTEAESIMLQSAGRIQDELCLGPNNKIQLILELNDEVGFDWSARTKHWCCTLPSIELQRLIGSPRSKTSRILLELPQPEGFTLSLSIEIDVRTGTKHELARPKT